MITSKKKIIKKPSTKVKVIKRTELEEEIFLILSGNKVGRNTSFTEKIFNNICEGISSSTRAVSKLCKENEITEQTFYKWLKLHPTLRERYSSAKSDQLRYMADEMLDIADNGSGDSHRDRLRIDTRKWLLSKLDPSTYGEKVEQTVINKTEQPMFFLGSNGEIEDAKII